jgi:hypothetical protein
VEIAQPPARRAQGRVAAPPRRPRPGVTDGVAVEVGQNFPTLIIDAEGARCAGEPHRLQVTQQRMNGRRLRAGSSADGLPNADGAIIAATGQPMLHKPGP